MQYRKDVDGLRAIAVAAIVIYHLSIFALPAGFLGVDIFFVISGFLITRIIDAEMAEGRFSLLDFYRRRVVRILPALLVMIAAVLVAGCLLMLPSELRALGQSAAAASAFASNLYFWAHTDYFGAPDVQPLLHTWSLAVEEQFYLIYPPVLLALRRWLPGQLRVALVAGTLGSLALGWWMPIDHPTGAFYMLPTRGWELGLGGLVALGCYPRLPDARAAQWIALAALAVLIAALVFPFGSGMPAPRAVPACLAAAALIAYGAEGLSARLLSLEPVRWLGRISYSLYLWHWPLISFYRGETEGNRPLDVLILTVAMLAAALLSYVLIERPIRERYRKHGNRAAIVGTGVAASLAIAAAATAIAANADHIRQLPPEAARVGAYFDYQTGPTFTYQFGPIACHAGTIPYDMANCFKPLAGKRNVAVFGDSHAAHIWRAIAERFPNDNVMEVASTNCLPLQGAGGGRLCRAMYDRMVAEFAKPGQVQAVILSVSWRPGAARLLAPTIRALRAGGAAVIVVGPSVRYRTNMPALLARAIWHGDFAPVERAREPGVALLDKRLRAAAEAEGATYYSLYDQECPGGKCLLLTASGAPYHFDESHLTLDGARELVKAMPNP